MANCVSGAATGARSAVLSPAPTSAVVCTTHAGAIPPGRHASSSSNRCSCMHSQWQSALGAGSARGSGRGLCWQALAPRPRGYSTVRAFSHIAEGGAEGAPSGPDSPARQASHTDDGCPRTNQFLGIPLNPRNARNLEMWWPCLAMELLIIAPHLCASGLPAHAALNTLSLQCALGAWVPTPRPP